MFCTTFLHLNWAFKKTWTRRIWVGWIWQKEYTTNMREAWKDVKLSLEVWIVSELSHYFASLGTILPSIHSPCLASTLLYCLVYWGRLRIECRTLSYLGLNSDNWKILSDAFFLYNDSSDPSACLLIPTGKRPMLPNNGVICRHWGWVPCSLLGIRF